MPELLTRLSFNRGRLIEVRVADEHEHLTSEPIGKPSLPGMRVTELRHGDWRGDHRTEERLFVETPHRTALGGDGGQSPDEIRHYLRPAVRGDRDLEYLRSQHSS